MPITAIQNTSINAKTKRKPNYVKITGYAAAGFGVASVVAAKNKGIKIHRYFAYLAGILTAAHIGILESYHFKKKK